MLAWDIDETYEVDARKKLEAVQSCPTDTIETPWVNLWGDSSHIRVDGCFSGHSSLGCRVKFYKTWAGYWSFNSPLVAGPSLAPRGNTRWYTRPLDSEFLNLACLHWGYMTRELRLQHKAKWDRNYGHYHASGVNPYGTWKHITDESVVANVVHISRLPEIYYR